MSEEKVDPIEGSGVGSSLLDFKRYWSPTIQTSTLFSNWLNVEAHADGLDIPDQRPHVDVFEPALSAAELRNASADCLRKFGLDKSLMLPLISEWETDAEHLGLFLRSLANDRIRVLLVRIAVPCEFYLRLLLFADIRVGSPVMLSPPVSPLKSPCGRESDLLRNKDLETTCGWTSPTGQDQVRNRSRVVSGWWSEASPRPHTFTDSQETTNDSTVHKGFHVQTFASHMLRNLAHADA